MVMPVQLPRKAEMETRGPLIVLRCTTVVGTRLGFFLAQSKAKVVSSMINRPGVSSVDYSKGSTTSGTVLISGKYKISEYYNRNSYNSKNPSN